MKAAVINKFGDTPKYKEFKNPEISEGDTLIQVKAVVLENFDKLVASGEHYASKSIFTRFPAIVGHSGVGTLKDGTLVTFGGVLPPFGAMAEQAVVPNKHQAYIQKVPKGIAPSVATSLPSAALTAYLALKYSANLQPGQNILINGATGVSGKLGVQIGKLLGTNRIIGTGRNERELKKIQSLGADDTINLNETEEEILNQLKENLKSGIDVIIDFVWGRPTELLLQALTPNEVGIPEHTVTLIQVGQSAGEDIRLKAEMIRTSGIEIKGVGNIKREDILQATQQIWEWVALNELSIDIEEISLSNISFAWKQDTKGKRIVIII